MKRIYILITVFCVCILSVSAQRKLMILHTNDTHSCIMPLNTSLTDTMLAGRGGFLRRVAMIKEERKKHPDLLLFDSGDFSQGSPYYTLFKGDVEIGLMNEMGYDASTVGNHEFDFGLENMARIFKKAKFPILCANYDFTGTPLEGIVKPYTIIKRNGVKIGVFGIDPEMDGLVIHKNYEGVKYLDPVSSAEKIASLLKNKLKCDVVICISHLGWGLKGMDDQRMIAGSRNIDLVLGGHSHTYFETLKYAKNLDGKEIPVDQNGKNAVFVGRLILNFDKK
ncbi:MAG: metallophosphatase [Prevotella pleuritidis]|uniref:bifunctional metallophosphatase/5'-nucleotidase n=1 Tax=Hoylesella pleuritidis TaxID=407975 RepID=UPI0004688339|nr:metallophosphatase [Hoylesella pleuritidis]MBF1554697.1 metallophosphatase [Hoylesella pleuritidis]